LASLFDESAVVSLPPCVFVYKPGYFLLVAVRPSNLLRSLNFVSKTLSSVNVPVSSGYSADCVYTMIGF